MATTGIFLTFSKDRTKDMIGRDLKFAGYANLDWNIFGIIFKDKMAATGVSFQSWKKLISPLLLVQRFGM